MKNKEKEGITNENIVQSDQSQSNQLDEIGSLDQQSAINLFEILFRNYQLLTETNVQADTIYHNRTSIITLTLGLLLAGYQAVLAKLDNQTIYIARAICILGLTLSILWYFFEQRNEIYSRGRGDVLKRLEEKLNALKKPARTDFQPFWTEVPAWVKKNAKWHQSVSAPFILRTLIPLLFAAIWLGIILFTPTIINPEKNESTGYNVIYDCDYNTASTQPAQHNPPLRNAVQPAENRK